MEAEVDDQDVWWYVCTLCYRATTDEAESREHKRQGHALSARRTNILILSQADDLNPWVRLTSCSPPRGNEVGRTSWSPTFKEEPHQLPNSESPTAPFPSSPDFGWKCTLCPTTCRTQAQLKTHALLHHTPARDEPSTAPEDLKPASWSSIICEDLRYCSVKITVTRSSADDDPRFYCGVCQCSFGLLPGLRWHIRSQHNETSCSCPVCQAPISNLDDLRTHVQESHEVGVDYWTCAKCLVEFSTQEEEMGHKMRMHGVSDGGVNSNGLVAFGAIRPRIGAGKRAPAPETDPESDEDYEGSEDSESDEDFEGLEASDDEHKLEEPTADGPLSEWRTAKLDLIKSTSRGEGGGQKPKPNSAGRYECSICEKTYAARRSLRDHLSDAHIRPPSIATRTCPTCNQLFSSAQYLKCHQKRMHITISKDYLCSVCGSTFKTADALKSHSRIHDPANKNQRCDECGKSFSKHGLWKHKFKHAARTHLCSECGKLFKSAMYLRTHQRAVHLELRPFKCDKCGERFKYYGILDRHMAKHLERRTLKCSMCPKMYKTKAQLSQHMYAAHPTKKRTFICRFCQQELPGIVSLRSHELDAHDFEHAPGRRCECKFCHKKFSQEFNLNSHEATHTNEATYECPVPDCGKKFKFSANLHQHKFSHMAYEELPNACEVEGCGKRFGSVVQLRNHKRRIHGVYDKPKRRGKLRDLQERE